MAAAGRSEPRPDHTTGRRGRGDRSAARDPMRSFGDAICAELSSGYPVYPVLVALDYALHSITHDAIAFLRIGRI